MHSDISSEEVDFDPFADEHQLLKVVPSTEAQKEIWISVQMSDQASCAFNESITLEFMGDVRESALLTSLKYIIQRHEALRTTFTSDGESLCVSESIDFALTKKSGDEKVFEQSVEQEAKTSFDLEKGPLIRFTLVSQDETKTWLILSAHHIICDGWSLAILVDDLSMAYNAALKNQEVGQTEAYSYSDYAHQSKELLDQSSDEAFWLDLYSGSLPSYDLPIEFERPGVRTFDASRLDFDVSQELIGQVKKLAGKQGVSLTAFMLSAFYTCLAKWSGEHDLVIGLPAASQPQYDSESLVGHCVNFLPLRMQLKDQDSFTSLLSNVSNLILDAYENQNYTYGSLLQKIAVERDSSRIPLCPVSFNVDQGIQGSKLNFQDLEVRFHSNPRAYENFEIFINASDYGDRFVIECQYNKNLFSEASIRSRLQEYRQVLTDLVGNVEKALSEIQLLSESEQADLFVKHSRVCDYGGLVSLPALFSQQAERTPEAIAVACDKNELTYQELHHRSNQVASYLIENGVIPGTLVGISLDRNVDLLVILLGVLKTGAGYVPLDPEYPVDRLNFMLEDAELTYLISQPNYIQRLSTVENSFLIQALLTESSGQPTKNPSVNITGGAICYVIYTSGSTGKPKGVMVPHSSVSNFLQSMVETPGIATTDKLLAVTTLSFDIAVLELYLPIISGAQVVIGTRGDVVDGNKLKGLMEQYEITMMQATPATWRLLCNEDWQGSDQFKILCGGEAFPPDLISELLKRSGQLWNMYGPTETTVWSTCHLLTSDEHNPSIGTAIANTDLYVLDEFFNVVPDGIPGELYIGGEGVTLGYLNRAELTQEKFVQLPVTENKIVYRTGDKVCFIGDGTLQYFGRLDNQVKLRGFRIELGEIESSIRQHDSVKDCALAVQQKSAGDERLVGFLVASGEEIDIKSIRELLSQSLPAYMIPQHFMIIDELPSTPNGKLDRKALPLFEFSSQDKRNVVEPKTENQRLLVRIWEDVLKMNEVSIEDNFFDLGGHSLLANKIITQLRKELNISIPLTFLFEFPTLQLMADNLPSENDADSLAPPTIEKSPDPFPASLSTSQQRLWFLHELYPDSALFNQVGIWKIFGEIDRSVFAQTISELVDRQFILNSKITRLNGSPMMVKKDKDQTLQEDEFKFSSSKNMEQELMEFIESKAKLPLNFDAGQYLKIHLIKLSDEEQVMMVITHPIIWDGWSFDILLSELSEIYGALLNNKPRNLQPLLINYMDFPEWHKSWMDSGVEQKQLDFWKKNLQGASTHTELPRDRARAGLSTYQGSRVSLFLEKGYVSQITNLAHKEGVTLYMVMLSAFFELLGQYSKQQDVTVATQIQGRVRPEFENVLGPFVNTVLLRNKTPESLTHSEMIQKVKKTCVDAFNHQDVPFEKVLDSVELNRKEKNAPPYQIMFTFQDTTNRSLEFAGLEMAQVNHNVQTAYTDMIFWLKETGAGLYGSFEYSTELFNSDTIRKFHDDYLQILDEIIVSPKKLISRDISKQEKPAQAEPEAFNKSAAEKVTEDKESSLEQQPVITATKENIKQIIISLWEDALEIDDIEPYDNFFDLGGHSLSSMMVLEKIYMEIGVQIPARSILMDSLAQIVEFCFQEVTNRSDIIQEASEQESKDGLDSSVDNSTKSFSKNIKSKLFKSFGFLKSGSDKA